MQTEPIEKTIMREILNFCIDTGMTTRAFGLQVANNTKLFIRLQKGRPLNSNSINQIRNYIANHQKESV